MHRALALLLSALALPAAAATFRSTTIEEAARSSDAVVRGRVERQASRLEADGRRIVTDVVVAVSSAWKGSPGARVTVTVPGGVVGDVGMWVSAAPRLANGEEVVLFLYRRGGGWRVNGLALGTFRVDGDRAEPDVDEADQLAAPTRAGEARIARTSLAELERRVRAAR
ncbi:hypothetical protein [Anaeromyxobacter dehalogenans]|uniref:hypothetical protein n=1 Tax=Anaeromyxobacter dehalogenans TaxID=161493 RepID=UPI0002D75AFA|nr:hypothetical protein [Anaeromyxobacter dehalogenans]